MTRMIGTTPGVEGDLCDSGLQVRATLRLRQLTMNGEWACAHTSFFSIMTAPLVKRTAFSTMSQAAS